MKSFLILISCLTAQWMAPAIAAPMEAVQPQDLITIIDTKNPAKRAYIGVQPNAQGDIANLYTWARDEDGKVESVLLELKDLGTPQSVIPDDNHEIVLASGKVLNPRYVVLDVEYKHNAFNPWDSPGHFKFSIRYNSAKNRYEGVDSNGEEMKTVYVKVRRRVIKVGVDEISLTP